MPAAAVPIEIAPALIDQVHDRLLTAIVDGSLRPGERLTQERIAVRLGVSRQPVSHALQLLKRRGLLIEAGRRGVSVAPLDPQRIVALYQVREVLDGLAARLAAERRRAGLVTMAEIAQLQQLVAQGLAFDQATPIRTWVEVDIAFHSSVHRLSGNAAIAETVAEQWPHFMRSMATVLVDADLRGRVWHEHKEILAAIVAADAAAAERLARAHASGSGIVTARRLLAAAASTSGAVAALPV